MVWLWQPYWFDAAGVPAGDYQKEPPIPAYAIPDKEALRATGVRLKKGWAGCPAHPI